MKETRLINLLKSCRSVLLDEILHEEKGEKLLFPLGIKKCIVEEINKELSDG